MKKLKLFDSRYALHITNFESIVLENLLECGKKVFCAYNMRMLKKCVNNNLESNNMIIKMSNDYYIYCDPNYDIKLAYNEGKIIQYKLKDYDDEWKNCKNDINFYLSLSNIELRVKDIKNENKNSIIFRNLSQMMRDLEKRINKVECVLSNIMNKFDITEKECSNCKNKKTLTNKMPCKMCINHSHFEKGDMNK